MRSGETFNHSHGGNMIRNDDKDKEIATIRQKCMELEAELTKQKKNFEAAVEGQCRIYAKLY